MTALSYARFDHDAYTHEEPDYTGIECTIEVENVPLRLRGKDGPVVAYIAGRVEIIGRDCASYTVGEVVWFDADDNRRGCPSYATPGSLEHQIRETLIKASDEDAMQTLHWMKGDR